MSSDHRNNSGVYPGSFDPITFGHLDIIYQAAKLMTKLHIIIGVNLGKTPLFSGEERIQMIRKDIDSVVTPRLEADNIQCDIKVVTHTGLIAAFMEANNAPFYIRGLRMGMEFDTEYPQLVASAQENPDFTPVFLCTIDPKLHHISSSLAREVERFNGKSTGSYVTPETAAKLKDRVTERGMRFEP